MDLVDGMHPVVALLVGLFVLVWIVLLLLVPFMVESIRGWTRKQHAELREMNRKLDRLTTLLGNYLDAQPAAEARAGGGQGGAPAGRREGREARREPTISDSTTYTTKREPKISSAEPEAPRAPRPRNPHAR